MLFDKESSLNIRLHQMASNHKKAHFYKQLFILTLPFRFVLVVVEEIWFNFDDLVRTRNFKIWLDKIRSGKSSSFEDLSEKQRAVIASGLQI